MFCFRHGEVGHVSTHNNAAAGSAIHFLSCGCFGTAEQLRDENYNPNPPAAPDPRVAELEARVAELEAELAAKKKPAAPPAADAASSVPESEPAGAEAGAPTAADTPAAPSDADSTKKAKA